MSNHYLQFSFSVPIQDAECRRWAAKHLGDLEPDFSWEWLPDGPLWIYAEESGDAEAATEFLQALVLQPGFDLLQVGFAYCYRCDSPRLDEFGGGAYLVRREGDKAEVRSIDTAEWLKEG